MRVRLRVWFIGLTLFSFALLLIFIPQASANRQQSTTNQITPPAKIDERDYLRLRDEYLARLRGIGSDGQFDPRPRASAIAQLEQQEAQAPASMTAGVPNSLLSVPTWTELGPRPLPNGETQVPGVTAPVSGRATAVVVDPTNSNKVYLGTAQGGVWRSIDGGNTWTTIFDSAQSLAIGALALAPSSPTTLYVGTGEAGSFESYFGVGLYRIDNADTTANLVGPINPAYSSGFGPTTVFTGRAITKILVHPTDPATIFVSTAGSFSGISAETLGNEIPPLGVRGVYRSTNATADAGSVTF